MPSAKSPKVKQLYRAAGTHLDAARALLGCCPERASHVRGHDVVYLGGYAVECSLKALLLSRYPSSRHDDRMRWFRSEIKHDLERVKAELRSKKVTMPAGQAANFVLVRSKWSSEMRYETRRWSWDDADRVFRAAEALSGWANDWSG